jgi:hypothetical protein
MAKNSFSDGLPSPVEDARAEAEKLTPHQWADRKGHGPKQDAFEPVPDWQFAAADVLHGWSAQAYAYQAEGEEFRITEDDYVAALDAAAQYPAKPAHAPAITPACTHRAQLLTEAATAKEPS